MSPYNGFQPNERMKALGWLRAEIAAGRRTAACKCDGCGQTAGVIDAHSENYSQPYGAHIGFFSFCFVCHMLLHMRFRSPAGWAEYRRRVREGQVCEPPNGRNFMYARNLCEALALQVVAPWPVVNAPRAETILDIITNDDATLWEGERSFISCIPEAARPVAA